MNKVMYVDWVKKIPEDDKMFIIDGGLLYVCFERKLKFDLSDETLSIFSFTGKYSNQTELICNHLNYFVKYYDQENRYMNALLRVKTMLDSRETPISKEAFINFLYNTIITQPIVDKVNEMVELNNVKSIEDDKKTSKYGSELSFTDDHNAILYRMAMCTNLLIPAILHYSHRFLRTTKMFLIDEYYNPLFEICGKGINLKEKLYNFIVNETKTSYKRDRITWNQKEMIGEFDPLSYAEERLKNIISNIIPKLDYKEGYHNIALIRTTVNNDFRNFTRDRYKLFPSEICEEKDNDDSLSQQDKMEMSQSRADVGVVIISEVNKNTVIDRLEKKLNHIIDDKEVEYYKQHYRPTDFQEELIKIYFAKHFSGFNELTSLRSDQFYKLVVLMKYEMQAKGFKYLQHLIVGQMLERSSTKNMRSMKFVEKIEQSSTYKRLVEKKYSRLLALKGDRIILDKLSVLLKTKFAFIEYRRPDILGTAIEIPEDEVSDEFLQFLSIV